MKQVNVSYIFLSLLIALSFKINCSFGRMCGKVWKHSLVDTKISADAWLNLLFPSVFEILCCFYHACWIIAECALDGFSRESRFIRWFLDAHTCNENCVPKMNLRSHDTTDDFYLPIHNRIIITICCSF